MSDATLNENEGATMERPNKPIKVSILFESLLKAGLFSLDDKVRSLALLDKELPWREVLARSMFWSGIGFILSGIIFFFAFNWESLHPFLKFALIQSGIALSVVLGLCKNFPLIIKRALLLAACILVGVFLAVFGQVYQTGANSYLLFITWTVIILPWVLLQNFSPLWAVFLVVGQTGLVLWRNQTGYLIEAGAHEVFLLFTLVNVLFLLLREILYNQGKRWLQEAWTRHALLVSSLAFCGLPTMEYVFSSQTLTPIITSLLITYALLHGTLIPYFKIFSKDAFCLGVLVLSLCGLLESTALHYIFNSPHRPQFKNIEFLVIAFVTMGIFILGFFAFKRLTHSLKERAQ
jgi:uncharacterized membrane protein